MNWYQYAMNDWTFYRSESRIQMYVEKGKITQEQYHSIVNGGESNAG